MRIVIVIVEFYLAIIAFCMILLKTSNSQHCLWEEN